MNEPFEEIRYMFTGLKRSLDVIGKETEENHKRTRVQE